MSSLYPKGSEWRQWDLHVHTPKSIIQEYGGDNDQNWDTFVQTIAALPPTVQVLGITDYLFIDGYEKLLSRRGEFNNILLLIPNLEFRLNTFSGTRNSRQRHNFHVLFDPAIPVQDIREQFLNCLSNGYHIDDNSVWQQTPTLRSLSELGRQIKARAPDGNPVRQKSDLIVGFDNITYKKDDILELLQKSCFKGRFVTAVGYSEWDQSRWDQSAAEKRDLISSSHFSLTCQDDPEVIASHREDLRTHKLNPLILHSSDAHRFDRLGKTLQWLKADPTFSGLKQVLNDPDARVFIGTQPPSYKPDHLVISNIRIGHSHQWFHDDFSLDLNRDLVTVIGGRGSGKSALAEAIAYGAGSEDDREDAFLRKAAKHKDPITGASIILTWADGTETQFNVGELETDPGLVRYLPQGAVEDLCSPQHSAELLAQIESVIFQALPDSAKLGSSNFDELRRRTLKEFQVQKSEVVKRVKDANVQLADLTAKIDALPSKTITLKEKRAEIKRLVDSLPALPPEDKKAQDDLAAMQEQRTLLESVIASQQAILNTLSEIESHVLIFKNSIQEFAEGLVPLLEAAGIADRTAFDVRIDADKIASVLTARRAEIATRIATVRTGTRGDVASLCDIAAVDLLADNLDGLVQAIAFKEKDTKAFETLKLKYQQQRRQIQSVELTATALEREIAAGDSELKPAKDRLVANRLDLYGTYIGILGEEMTRIEELYKPLQDSLAAGSATKQKLEFHAQIRYDSERHCNAGLRIIDRTRRGSFRDANALRDSLRETWELAERTGLSRDVLVSRLNALEAQFTSCEGTSIRIEDQLRENIGLSTFLDWLYDPTVFEIVSSLDFDGVNLYLLSQGQKGIILLMLYLAIDKDDNRPLIIDQPEQNLDNLSVYADLISYFRERKQNRQIIMITHNPNLVVNTDAEQVIIANYHGQRNPRLIYDSGSLENHAQLRPGVPVEELENGIIEQVCDVLEGGESAFDKRRKKYRISDKTTL